MTIRPGTRRHSWLSLRIGSLSPFYVYFRKRFQRILSARNIGAQRPQDPLFPRFASCSYSLRPYLVAYLHDDEDYQGDDNESYYGN